MPFQLPKISLQARLCICLAVIALSVYSITLRNSYALDDFILIKQNTIVTRGIAAIPELLTTPYFKGNLVASFDYYRPLSLIMFAIEYQLFNDSPMMGHLINILVFAACIVLLFLFLDRLFNGQRTGAALFTALLFAIHPVNTEVVANIKSRDQLLCFLFTFGAMQVLLSFARNGRVTQLALGGLMFFLSLLSKETSITFLALIPFVFFLFANQEQRRTWYITGAVWFTAAVYLVVRFAVLHSISGSVNPGYTFLDNILAQAPDFSTRIATAFFVLGKYLQLLVVPYPLISDYSYHTISFTTFANPVVWLSVGAYVAMIAVAFGRMRNNRKDPIGLAIVFFLVSISIFSNLFFLIAGIMAERFLFFAAVGFCMVPAYALDHWLHSRGAGQPETWKKGVLYLMPVVLLFSVVTMARGIEWQDNATLFKADVHKAPENCRLQYNMGTNILIAAENLPPEDPARVKLSQEGIGYLKKAIAIYPDYALAWSEIGNTYVRMVNYDSAEVYCARTIVLNPRDAVALENLAAIYFKSGRFEQSLAICRSAVKLDSNYARGYRNMGSCYLRLGKNDSAVVAYKTALAIEPSFAQVYERLAIAYKLAGNLDSAVKYKEIARISNPAFDY